MIRHPFLLFRTSQLITECEIKTEAEQSERLLQNPGLQKRRRLGNHQEGLQETSVVTSSWYGVEPSGVGGRVVNNQI